MHDVSNAINVLDPTEALDLASNCTHDKSGKSTSSNHGKCQAHSSGSNVSGKLSEPFSNLGAHATELVNDPDTVTNISKVMTGTKLNRDQKGIVSSAFAKAHEGAEIPHSGDGRTSSTAVTGCKYYE